MISFLSGYMSLRAARIIGWFVVPLLVLAVLWLAIDAFGNARYRAGVADTDAKWVEAGKRLQREAAASAGKADDRAAARLEQHVEEVAKEKEALDEAQRTGSSPLDVLFGG